MMVPMGRSAYEHYPDEIAALLLAVEARQGENDSAHRMDHVLGVVGNCLKILREINCREMVVLYAATLHDIVPRAGLADARNATTASATAVRVFLPNHSEDAIREISECIVSGSWEHHAAGGKPHNVESYVLRDADLLEAIGARGLARVFAFSGSHGLPIGDPPASAADGPAQEPLPNGIDRTAFEHIERKLLALQPLIYSETAKREAARRHAYIAAFKVAYLREMAWSGMTGA